MNMNKKSNELCLTRVYRARIQKVWDAWVDPCLSS